jgi:hypothetical protein
MEFKMRMIVVSLFIVGLQSGLFAEDVIPPWKTKEITDYRKERPSIGRSAVTLVEKRKDESNAAYLERIRGYFKIYDTILSGQIIPGENAASMDKFERSIKCYYYEIIILKSAEALGAYGTYDDGQMLFKYSKIKPPEIYSKVDMQLGIYVVPLLLKAPEDKLFDVLKEILVLPGPTIYGNTKPALEALGKHPRKKEIEKIYIDMLKENKVSWLLGGEPRAVFLTTKISLDDINNLYDNGSNLCKVILLEVYANLYPEDFVKRATSLLDAGAGDVMPADKLKMLVLRYSQRLSPDVVAPLAKYFPIIKYCLDIRNSNIKTSITINKDNGETLFGNLNSPTFYGMLTGKDILFLIEMDNINELTGIFRNSNDNTLFFLNCKKNNWVVKIIVKKPTVITYDIVLRLIEAYTTILELYISSDEEDSRYDEEIIKPLMKTPVRIIKRILYSPK